MASLDEPVAVGPVERAEEAVDPVPRVAVDALDAPLAQAFQEIVGDELAHGSVLLGVALPKVVDAGPERETPGAVWASSFLRAQTPPGLGASNATALAASIECDIEFVPRP